MIPVTISFNLILKKFGEVKKADFIEKNVKAFVTPVTLSFDLTFKEILSIKKIRIYRKKYQNTYDTCDIFVAFI